MEKASLKFVFFFILSVFVSSVLMSVEAAKCVRDIDCSFQCRSGRGVCVDKTHECLCLPPVETSAESILPSAAKGLPCRTNKDCGPNVIRCVPEALPQCLNHECHCVLRSTVKAGNGPSCESTKDCDPIVIRCSPEATLECFNHECQCIISYH